MCDEREISPELKDIREMIKRYNVSHKEGCFIFTFVGFEKDMENKCECGEQCSKVREDKTLCGVHGDLFTLREMLNHMRDEIEDNIDENGFVNF